MTSNEYVPKASLAELPQVGDRASFLYLEQCTVTREFGAVMMTNEDGRAFVPSAGLTALLLGPGTTITHRAVELLGDSGVSLIWVGEHGVRFYAHGVGLTHSARLQIIQAKLVSNVRTRAAVARKMYAMRFPNENVEKDSLQILRGKEGARVRGVYRKLAKSSGVAWSGREYDPEDFAGSDLINMALSCAHQCLYGLAHAAIVGIGCSPALGFVHTGHDKSFVYDIADLYKAEFSIPVAFEVCSENPDQNLDIEHETRVLMRSKIHSSKLLHRMVFDIRKLLTESASEEDSADFEEYQQDSQASVVKLWDDQYGEVANAHNYAPNDFESDIQSDNESDTQSDSEFDYESEKISAGKGSAELDEYDQDSQASVVTLWGAPQGEVAETRNYAYDETESDPKIIEPSETIEYLKKVGKNDSDSHGKEDSN